MTDESRWFDEFGTVRTAREVLDAYEQGILNDDSRLSILKDAPALPLRRYIREIVWSAYREEQGPEESPSLQQTYATAFHEAPVALVISDLSGRILHANDAAVELLGYPQAEIAKMRVGELSAQNEDRREEIQQGNQVLAGKIDSFQVEREFVHKDGRRISGLLNVAMVRDEAGAPAQVIGQILDLTRLKALEKELVRAERLQTAGRLASGVAHDFNNLITVILGNLDKIERTSISEAKGAFSSIREVCSLGARMTGQLMAFSRDGVVELAVMDVREQLREAQRVLHATTPKQIGVELEVSSCPLPVRANAVLLEQVFVNLGNNARHAMPNGGTITLRALRDHEHAVIQVQDTGVGMPPEVIESAFEPFFTTRESEGGTGLGLATVYGTVRRFGGEIGITSEVGEGTTFHIRLELVEDEVTSDPGAVEVSAEPQDVVPTDEVRAARVLVVDDQVAIAKIIQRVIERDGMTVSVADGFESARAMIQASADAPFDLVISDVRLEDGTGIDVRNCVRASSADTHVMFISGYTADVLSEEDLVEENSSFLQKPFEPEELRIAVRRVLNR